MLRRRKTSDTDVHTGAAEPGRRRGAGLAKVPALAIGTVLVVFGLSGLLTNADFPSASSNFPDGFASGETWLGIEVNGWTNWLAIAAGALLLFGSARHVMAKAMSVLVGVALGVAAVAATIDGDDVFGLAAANTWTKLGLAVTAVLLLAGALMPRTRGRTGDDDVVVTRDRDRDRGHGIAGDERHGDDAQGGRFTREGKPARDADTVRDGEPAVARPGDRRPVER